MPDIAQEEIHNSLKGGDDSLILIRHFAFSPLHPILVGVSKTLQTQGQYLTR